MLKKFIFINFTFLGLFAAAVELSQATNDQILYELSTRLGTGNTSMSSQVTITCVGHFSEQLQIENIDSLGGSKTKVIPLNSMDGCHNQLKGFDPSYFRLYQTKLIAVCQARANYTVYLMKFPIFPNGQIGNVVEAEVKGSSGVFDNCLRQAKKINELN